MQQSVKLQDIQFPVYRIGEEKPSEDGGVHYYLYGRDTDSSDAVSVIKIVDDKNIDKPTLSLRRLEIAKSGGNLYKLSKAVFFIQDLIKLAKSSTWFIDTEGKVFQYTKTKRVNLTFRKISRVIPIRTGGALIEVEGLPLRFKVLFEPVNMHFAGILSVGVGYILYGLYPDKPEDSFRYI